VSQTAAISRLWLGSQKEVAGRSFYDTDVIANESVTLEFNPLYFIERNLVFGPIIELGGTRGLMSRYLLSMLEWGHAEDQSRARNFAMSEGWVWLQGESRVTGRLVGGCLEVLEFLKGTAWWIPKRLWDGAIFFFETSEEAPPPNWVGYWLRNYGSQGILERISGMLVARPMKYSPQMTKTLYAEIRRVLAEFGREDLPLVANMDFGHTSPQMVMPIGCRAMIDPGKKRVSILEAGVT
jgi:muramoyltetrapeptide carboxypeptidase LdcA involved in peptidoglycan recycling